MDKKLILAGGIVIIIAVIAAVLFSSQKSPEQSQEAVTEEEISQQDEEESITGSILNLLQGGRNVSCTYSLDTEGGITSGTVYIAGEKMYGEFKTTAGNGQAFDSFIIRDGEYVYTWSSALPNGTKMKIDEDSEKMEGDETEGDETTKSLEQDLDLKCRGWSVDNSKFVPPTDIEFTDLSKQLEQVQGVTEGLGQNPQDVCNQLPGEAKQQCLDALGNAN